MREYRDTKRNVERTAAKEVPAIYLPWVQRVLNPFPLASSGAGLCDQSQPWAVNILAFYCSVFVNGPNNGTNFWTIALINAVGTVLASFNTSAIAAGVYTRFAITSGITQPATTNPTLIVIATATLAPGSIYIAPAVALLRQG